MTLASVVVCCLSFACSTLGIGSQPASLHLPAATMAASNTMALSQESTPPSQQTPAAQSPDSPAPQAAPASQPQNPQAKPPAAKPHRSSKKTGTPDCSTAPSALNPTVINSADSTSAASSNAGSSSTVSSNTGSPAQKPCPPPKVVVKNGGSNEPAVELKGGCAAEASYQRATTEQLVKETKENLDKIKELQLTPSQQETVTQINHFTEQSKAAVAAGDVERGRNLAMKARLLSDELLKP